MDVQALWARNIASHRSLFSKSRAVLSNQTPGRPLRPEEEGLLLAQDLTNHAAVKKALPFFLHDATTPTGESLVVLTDGKRNTAVLAVKHVPPGMLGSLEASKLEAAGRLAQQRARQLVEEGNLPGATSKHDGQVAVGVVSNARGLEWLDPPSPSKRQLAALTPQNQAAAVAAETLPPALAGQVISTSASSQQRWVQHALDCARVVVFGCATAAAAWLALLAISSGSES